MILEPIPFSEGKIAVSRISSPLPPAANSKPPTQRTQQQQQGMSSPRARIRTRDMTALDVLWRNPRAGILIMITTRSPYLNLNSQYLISLLKSESQQGKREKGRKCEVTRNENWFRDLSSALRCWLFWGGALGRG